MVSEALKKNGTELFLLVIIIAIAFHEGDSYLCIYIYLFAILAYSHPYWECQDQRTTYLQKQGQSVRVQR